MEADITARNLTLTDTSHEHIAKKLARVGRHLNNISDAKVELKRESTRADEDRIVAQVTLNCGGTILRSQERAATVAAAIDEVTDVLDRRVRRLKGRIYRSEQARKAGRTASIRDVAPPEEVVDATDDLPDAEDEPIFEEPERIARIKRFPMKPMTVEEAADQLENLGHDFYFFYNMESGEYNVLYRRASEGYGLLQPELD